MPRTILCFPCADGLRSRSTMINPFSFLTLGLLNGDVWSEKGRQKILYQRLTGLLVCMFLLYGSIMAGCVFSLIIHHSVVRRSTRRESIQRFKGYSRYAFLSRIFLEWNLLIFEVGFPFCCRQIYILALYSQCSFFLDMWMGTDFLLIRLLRPADDMTREQGIEKHNYHSSDSNFKGVKKRNKGCCNDWRRTTSYINTASFECVHIIPIRNHGSLPYFLCCFASVLRNKQSISFKATGNLTRQIITPLLYIKYLCLSWDFHDFVCKTFMDKVTAQAISSFQFSVVLWCRHINPLMWKILIKGPKHIEAPCFHVRRTLDKNFTFPFLLN